MQIVFISIPGGHRKVDSLQARVIVNFLKKDFVTIKFVQPKAAKVS